VINARHTVQKYHGSAIYGGGHHAIDASLECGYHHAQHQCRYRKGAAHYMGHHIEYFFSLCIGGKNTVSQLGSQFKYLRFFIGFYDNIQIMENQYNFVNIRID
jgi:hypothetical protein